MVKVERSYPAPESLAIEAAKKNGSYNEKDVVERLKSDFNDKCYICEIKGLQDPEALLKFPFVGDDVDISAIDVDDAQSVLTATLIHETFNLRNTGIRIAACDTRMDELRKAMIVLYRELENYQREPDSEKNRRRMKVLLSRRSAFAAFKRGYVRERLNEYPELKEYVC